MKIFNGTPHNINIIEGAEFVPSIRKYINGSIVRTIPSDGVVSAKMEVVHTGDIDGIPRYEKTVTGVDPLPDGYDLYIVSAIYAVAHRATYGSASNNIYTIADPVIVAIDNPTIIGCIGIMPAL